MLVAALFVLLSVRSLLVLLVGAFFLLVSTVVLYFLVKFFGCALLSF